MKGRLRYTENKEWIVSYEMEGNPTRNLPIHNEQLVEMQEFDVDEEYEVDFSLCFIVQLQKYCVRISRSSFPEKIPDSVMDLPKITKFELIEEETGDILYTSSINGTCLSFENNGKTLKVKLK